MTKPLHIPPALARQIEREGIRAYPHECCGILFGRDAASHRLIERLRAADNVCDESERARRFAIDPLELVRAERDAADAGLWVLGFYHSHPDQPARPSDFDRSRAWPVYSYVIVSIQSGQAVDLTSWVLDDRSGSFVRQEMIEAEPSGVMEGESDHA